MGILRLDLWTVSRVLNIIYNQPLVLRKKDRIRKIGCSEMNKILIYLL